MRKSTAAMKETARAVRGVLMREDTPLRKDTAATTGDSSPTYTMTGMVDTVARGDMPMGGDTTKSEDTPRRKNTSTRENTPTRGQSPTIQTPRSKRRRIRGVSRR